MGNACMNSEFKNSQFLRHLVGSLFLVPCSLFLVRFVLKRLP